PTISIHSRHVRDHSSEPIAVALIRTQPVSQAYHQLHRVWYIGCGRNGRWHQVETLDTNPLERCNQTVVLGRGIKLQRDGRDRRRIARARFEGPKLKSAPTELGQGKWSNS